MNKEKKFDIKKMAGVAVFIAIVVVLQIIGSFIKFGAFSISLVLVPIAVGAALYGQAAGAVLGGAFGIVVLVSCINGTDPGGNMLFAANPAFTSVLCLLKGMFAGYAAGFVYKIVSKRNDYLGVVCAAFICPIVNTGIFIISMIFIYREILLAWAGDSDFLYYAFISVAGVNFLLELSVNVIFSPAIVRIVRAVKKPAV